MDSSNDAQSARFSTSACGTDLAKDSKDEQPSAPGTAGFTSTAEPVGMSADLEMDDVKVVGEKRCFDDRTDLKKDAKRSRSDMDSNGTQKVDGGSEV